MECEHVCTSQCRRTGCNCDCGNTHCDECKGTGFIEIIQWVDTDTSYPETVRCRNCNDED